MDTISATELVTASRADAFVAAAEAAAYKPLSGLQQVFEDAVVTRIGNAHYITVPLAGTNMAEMTKVVYVYDGKATTTVEFAAAVVDAAHARLQMWQDGVSIKDVELYDPALESATSGQSAIVQTGFSWSKLNKCLCPTRASPRGCSA
ncbi:hypothetical protein [Cellulomonas sp.]|uniref:hypothetical protein n=1 Tax=Cellulomonas sp. TaxID=40001 RepID=UPI003BABB6CB